MALFSKTLFTKPFWDQTKDETWKNESGTNYIDQNYLKDFKTSGCYLCAITMLTAYMEGSTTMKPSRLVGRKVTSATSPYINNWNNASSKFKFTSCTSDMISRIAEAVLVDEVPVIIQVPGHAVVAYGFYGSLPVHAGTVPLVSAATEDMIKIYDPYTGRYNDDLSGLIYHYGAISEIKIPE